MEIQIRRREEISHLPTKVINEARVFLGSHYDGRGPLRGLDAEDEKKYLPEIIGVSPNSPEWAKKTRDFWAEMGFLVPSSGVVLNITWDEELKRPYNLEDWLKYKWAQRHKLVAESLKELENNPRKKFYIFDPLEDTKRKNSEIQARKAADVEFIKASKDVDKARRIIRIMDGMINPEALSEQQVENKLYDLKNEQPVRFYQIASDKKLDIKAEITELIAQQILRKVGNQIIYIDQVIAESMEDAVAWYTNAKNSSVVTTLKAKLNEHKTSRV